MLLRKLLDFGITGNFFNIIKQIYSADEAAIKSGNSRSDFFSLNFDLEYAKNIFQTYFRHKK